MQFGPLSGSDVKERQRAARGFTLIEVLITITVIMVLVGLAMAAIAVVRTSVAKGGARTRLVAIGMAMEQYQSEERRHRYPPMSSDAMRPYMYSMTVVGGGVPLVLDLLRGYKDGAGKQIGVNCLNWVKDELEQGALIDPWGRPYRYVLDSDPAIVGDPTNGVVKPAGLLADEQPDWNAQGNDIFPYVYSLGKPNREATDANKANVANWIYLRTSK